MVIIKHIVNSKRRFSNSYRTINQRRGQGIGIPRHCCAPLVMTTLSADLMVQHFLRVNVANLWEVVHFKEGSQLRSVGADASFHSNFLASKSGSHSMEDGRIGDSYFGLRLRTALLGSQLKDGSQAGWGVKGHLIGDLAD